jgi:hypothetical protein
MDTNSTDDQLSAADDIVAELYELVGRPSLEEDSEANPDIFPLNLSHFFLITTLIFSVNQQTQFLQL